MFAIVIVMWLELNLVNLPQKDWGQKKKKKIDERKIDVGFLFFLRRV